MVNLASGEEGEGRRFPIGAPTHSSAPWTMGLCSSTSGQQALTKLYDVVLLLSVCVRGDSVPPRRGSGGGCGRRAFQKCVAGSYVEELPRRRDLPPVPVHQRVFFSSGVTEQLELFPAKL